MNFVGKVIYIYINLGTAIVTKYLLNYYYLLYFHEFEFYCTDFQLVIIAKQKDRHFYLQLCGTIYYNF